MPVNPDAVSAARQPRGIVNVGGVRVDGWIRFEADNNTFSEADTFRVVFALSALPAAYGDAFWAAQTEVFVEVFAGFPVDAERYSAKELQSLVYGRVDDVEFDPVARTVTVSGRDLTAILIDARTTESFQNMVASDIAKKFALRHGFTPVVKATTRKVGKYFEIDTVKVNTQRSEWDILTQLAAAEGFSVFAKGHELHFHPIQSDSAHDYAPYQRSNNYALKWEPPNDQSGAYGFNGKSINFRRALNIARGVVVEVTYTMANKKGTFHARYPNKAADIKVGKSAASSQLYRITMLNASPQAAIDRAQREHSIITKHEVKMTATMPADNILTTTNIITVTGTGTAFDQTYYPESIMREMDVSTGYSMTVHAKNHSPETVVAI